MSFWSTTNNYFMIIGIRPLPKKYFPSRTIQMLFNTLHIIFAIVTFVTYSISIMCFLIFKAMSSTQFSEAGMFYMVGYLHLSFYTIAVFKRSKIFSFMESLEKVIELSKNFMKLFVKSKILIEFDSSFYGTGSKKPSIRFIYTQANDLSELFGKYLWNSMMLCAQFFVYPSAFVSYYKYYVLEQGDQSFHQIFPAA